MTDSSAHTLAGALALLVTGLAFGTGVYAAVSLSPQSLGASVAESAPLTVTLSPGTARKVTPSFLGRKVSRYTPARRRIVSPGWATAQALVRLAKGTAG